MSKGINKRAMDRQRTRELQNQRRYERREMRRMDAGQPTMSLLVSAEELERLLSTTKPTGVVDAPVGSKIRPTARGALAEASVMLTSVHVLAEADPGRSSDAAKPMASESGQKPIPVSEVRPEMTRAQGTAKTASMVLNLLSPLFPKRIANEDLGDAIEDLNRMAIEGHPAWQIAVRAVVWILVLVLSLVRFVAAAITGQDVKRAG